MQLVMLSGNSMANRDWIYTVQAQVAGLFGETYLQDYRHWKIGEKWIDLPHELEVLKSHEFGGSYGVFAKSIGTVLAVQAIQREIIHPKFMLLCGLPLGYIVEDYPDFAQDLAKCNAPVTIIHNENDKVGSAELVREYLDRDMSNSNYEFVETPGDTHEYKDYDLVRTELMKLMGQWG